MENIENKENKGATNFFFIVVAAILGPALYKQFDFDTLKFEKPALAIIYFITFSISIILLVKNLINRPKQ